MGKIPPKRGKPTQYPSIRVESPGLGLNNLISDTLIKDTEASDLNNIQFVESGCPAKTTGKSVWGSGLTNKPKGLGSFTTTTGGFYVVTVDGGVVKSTTLKGDAWTAVTGATMTTGKETTFTQARGKLYIWNGFDGGIVWGGVSSSSLSAPGTLPSAGFSIFYQGLHIASGSASQQSRVYVSASTDAAKFTTSAAGNTPASTANVPGTSVQNGAPAYGTDAQFFDVDANDGQIVTGLAKFKDVLIVFKTNSIYQVVFDPSGVPTVTPILHYLGAVGHRSIDNVDNNVYYLSRLGWMNLGNEPQYFTIIRTNELSARIHPIVDTINPSSLSKVVSLYAPYKFYSSIPSGGSTTNNRTVTYDTRFGAWSKLDIVHANAFTVYTDSTNTQHTLFAADDEAKVYELDTSYSDNGNAISAFWTSKAFTAGESDLYKRWIDITLLFRQISGSIKITVYADGGQIAHTSTIPSGSVDGGWGQTGFGAELWGGNISATTTSVDTTATNNIPYRIRVNTTSRTLKIKVENNNVNETFVLLGLHMTYRDFSHFKFPSALKIN